MNRHSTPSLLALLPVLLILFSAGCATGGMSTLRTEIQDLQNRIYEIQKRQAESQVEIQGLREELREGAGSGSEPAGASPHAQNGSAISSGEPAVPGSTVDMDSAGPTRHTSSPSGSPPVLEPTPPVASTTTPSGGGVEEAPDKLYVEGYSQFNTGKYLEAQKSFEEFLRRSPESDLADDAQYWVGECFFSLKDYRRAILEFRRVIDQYPFGNKVPQSFFRVGLSYLALGERDRAAENLETVVQAFPKSDVATVARATLDEIQKR